METRGAKIVIVEDEGLIAADLSSRLEDAGYAVASIADTGAKAMRAIAETSPDLVVMDIRLKGEMDGIDVAERVHAQYNLPVVYLTAYEDNRTLERVVHSQAFGYLKKPVGSASLRTTVDLALRQHHEEHDLRRQRDWFSASFAAVPDAVVVTDEFGRISYLNEHAEQLIGVDAEHARGEPWRNCVRLLYASPGAPEEELRPVEDLVPVALLEGDSVPLPDGVCVAARDGLHTVEGTVAPCWHDGHLVGALVAFRDIGIRQIAEARHRLDDRQEALGRLAAAVSGRLDLELATAADESASLLQRLPAVSPLRDHAEMVAMATKDAATMIGRLQSFAEHPAVSMQPVSLNELVTSLKPHWQRVFPNLSVLLGAVPCPADADPGQLPRALLILLRHASRSRRPGAGMVLETSCAELAGLGSWVKIRIAYASFGENTTLLERAFEPDWSGPGDDLATCYRLVHEMHGFLSAGLEQGMTVAWEIYLRQCAAAGEAVRNPTAPSVILVEANPRVGALLQRQFEEHGVRLLCASTCSEAVIAVKFHEGAVNAVVANVPEGDPGRQELAGLPVDIPVYWLPGYRDPRSGKLLTKGQVAERTQFALASPPQALTATQGGSVRF